MNARPPSTPESPLDLTIRSLRAWPDGELFALARGVAAELLRRRRPVPVALPVVDVLGAGIWGAEIKMTNGE